MAIVNVKWRGDIQRAEVEWCNKSGRVINVCRAFQTKGKATADKEQTTPLKTKINAAVRSEEDVVKPKLIIAHVWWKYFCMYLVRCWTLSWAKGRSSIHRFKKTVVVAKPGLGRFHCQWHDKVGRETRSYSSPKRNGTRCKPFHDRVRNRLWDGLARQKISEHSGWRDIAVIINSVVTPVEISKKVSDVDKIIDPI